ncbi:hypothetical protein NWF34_10070 [Gordonia sp. GONU]|uniref:phage portal protein family protein n=1 Tax=Gordonia sp. GONU TaxID=2972949 RepID=UPI0021AD4A82|nr:hypothetical protein [Gordonia sp. GONU]MCR8897294.1 hypothetical protein [Gordonia sp. GONU]
MAEVEVKPPKAAFSEKGYVADSSGGPGWPQWVQDERVPDLQWPESVQTFGRMLREDSRVSSLYAAITLPIRRTPWRIAANGARDEVVEFVAKNFNLPIEGGDNLPQPTRTKGKFSWVQHLQQALTALPYGHCVDYETEILTQRGWLNGRDLCEGDQVMTLDPETGRGEWQPCETVHHWEGQHTVRHLEGRSHSSVSTLNHKWITRDYDSKKLRFRTSAELNTNDRIIRAAPTANLPTEPKWSDAFVELVAWYWTEGQEHPGGGICLWQSEAVNSWKCQRIRETLTTLYGPGQESLKHGRGGWRETVRMSGVVKKPTASWYITKSLAEDIRRIAPGKVVSGEFISQLTSAQLRLFIEVSLDADGHRGRGGAGYIAQKKPEMLDAFEMACSLLGIPWTRSTPPSGGNACTRTGKQIEVRPVANAQRATRGKNTADTLETVEGVWCPQVPNRTWLARRRGTVYFTGNSVFEQVYWPPDDAGRTFLRKLAPRPQRTISNWNVALDGGLMSIEQYAPASNGRVLYGINPLRIPIGRLVVYSRDQDPGVWWGNSLLRPSYKHWLIKDELIRYQAVAIKRTGMGVPVATAAPGATQEDVDALAEMAQQYRGGDNSGVGLPYQGDLKLVTPNGNLIDIGAAIAYHDNMIAIAGLAHFLNLEGGGGSYALASVQEHTFTQSVQTTAEWVRDTATAHIVEDLVDINFGVDEPSPRLVFDEIGSRRDLTEAGLKLLVDAGLLSPDVFVEQAVRQRLGLPAKSADTPTEPAVPTPGVAS